MNIQEKLDEYASYHKNPKNVLTHFIGIPLIVFALMLWCSWIVIGVPGTITIPLSWVLTASLLGLYATHSWRSAAISAVALVPLLIVAYLLHFAHVLRPGWIALGCFVIGWALQFVGHIFEAQKPAFLDNLMHLLVGPLFIILEAYQMVTSSRSDGQQKKHKSAP